MIWIIFAIVAQVDAAASAGLLAMRSPQREEKPLCTRVPRRFSAEFSAYLAEDEVKCDKYQAASSAIRNAEKEMQSYQKDVLAKGKQGALLRRALIDVFSRVRCFVHLEGIAEDKELWSAVSALERKTSGKRRNYEAVRLMDLVHKLNAAWGVKCDVEDEAVALFESVKFAGARGDVR